MKPLPSHAEIVIVGGGIIGVSIAYHLARRGYETGARPLYHDGGFDK